jgi:VWFA-related protein
VAFNAVSVPRAPVPVAGTVRHVLDAPVMSTVATNAGADEARLFVLVLDNAASSPDTTIPVRQLARDFIERFVGPSDLVTAFPTRGWDQLTQEFTTDKVRALQTIDNYIGNRCRGHESEAEKVYIARVATDVLGAIAKHLETVRGRRVSLIWISEGFDGPNFRILPADFGTSSTFGNHIESGARPDPSAVVHATNVAIQTLQRTNVTVFAVDPRRLAPPRGSYHPKENPCGYPRAAGRDSLVTFSEETGGFAAIDYNDYSPQFNRILDESSQYYVLGYQPNRPARDGEFRRIRVRVTKPGLERAAVNARAGYTVSSPREPEPGPPGATPDLTRAISTSVPMAGLPLRVQAVPRRGTDGRGLVYLVVEVGAADLQFAENAGEFTERLEFGLVTLDRVARPTSAQNAAMDLKLTAAQLAEVRDHGVRWLTTLDLKPGHARLRLAVHAAGSKRSGTVFLDVDVPKYGDDELRIDGVALTAPGAERTPTSGVSPTALGLPGPPTTARRFVRGDVISVGAELGVPRDFVQGVVRLTVESQQAGAGAPPILTREVPLPDRAAADPVRVFAIETAALGVGPFVLRLVLEDQQGRHTDTAVLFEVVEQSG